MERSVEQALRACGSAVPASAIGLLDEVRARLFGTTPRRARLGRYEILGRVGAGGGGVVLRAFDPRLQRDVAIKVVHAHGGEPAQVRLLREARALARISHPNVVALFDVGRVDTARDTELARFAGTAVDGSVYLVMEWLDGGDLAAWLAARPRPWPEIVRAFVAAGRGLEAAHAAGVLHRDFKPQNVVLGRHGARVDACLRVADFGLTRPRDPSSSEIVADDLDQPFGITRPDTVMGTPIYMAPEQHVGGTIDERTDQYAFCTALHEALAGPRAYESLTALVAAKLAGPPPLAVPGV
ncbi:MAG TPA: serine/threonine-protein kinase, partial [Nannocystaceae bacterium]|nr:serine/threonine-protein kinase [Nannocystaceae bacterium]